MSVYLCLSVSLFVSDSLSVYVCVAFALRCDRDCLALYSTLRVWPQML